MADNQISKQSKLNVEIPERCPICKKKKVNLLRHIRAREECYQKIDKSLFDQWKVVSRKKTKSKYQYKYVDRGDHMKAQEKYLKKKKATEQAWYRKKRIREEQRRRMSKEFIWLSTNCLMWLARGKIPPDWMLRNFCLVDRDTEYWKEKMMLTQEESTAWLSEIDTAFLEAVISIQTVVSIPKSKWLSAIDTLEIDQEKVELKDKLYKLIGKLQAGEDENTVGISIPKRYQSNTGEILQWDQKKAFQENKLTRKDELMLIDLVSDILGDEEGLLCVEFQELLGIRKEIENLFNAFTYTINKYD